MTVEIVVCPLCRSEIHRHVSGRVVTRMKLPSRTTQGANALTMLTMAAMAEREEELAACERACTAHYWSEHRLRVRLWRRLGWSWLMRWPTRDPLKSSAFGQTQMYPRFVKEDS